MAEALLVEMPAAFARAVRMLPAAWWDGALLGAMALIWYVSSQPHWPVPELFDLQDKLMHAGAYGVLGIIAFGWCLRRWAHWPMLRAALLAWAIASGWGVIDELHQSFVPGRTADGWDAIADALGAFFAIWALQRGADAI